jgi:succinate dehydrogenase / fumarate reductase iron-sulfur subunit
MKFSIYRYDPDRDAKPYMQDYELPEAQIQPGMMLLDALLLLKADDETLSFRRSCQEGVCGSDGMNINGRNGLACVTPLASLNKPVEIRPLPGLPVIRDLVVDMEQFYQQYRNAKPYLINDDPCPEVERLLTPEQRDQLDGLNASCAPAAQPLARRSGGTRTSFSAPRRCCRPGAFWPIPATRPPKNG